MKVLILYRPQSETARRVDEFVHEFQRLYPGKSIDVLDIDTAAGTTLVDLYDITSQPAVLALKDDRQLIQSWIGDQLPLMNEIAYYANA